jgi:hypothetical protein
MALGSGRRGDIAPQSFQQPPLLPSSAAAGPIHERVEREGGCWEPRGRLVSLIRVAAVLPVTAAAILSGTQKSDAEGSQLVDHSRNCNRHRHNIGVRAALDRLAANPPPRACGPMVRYGGAKLHRLPESALGQGPRPVQGGLTGSRDNRPALSHRNRVAPGEAVAWVSGKSAPFGNRNARHAFCPHDLGIDL